MQPGQPAGDQLHHTRRYLAVSQVDKIRPESGGNGLVKSVFIDESAIDHRLSDALPVHRDFIQNVVRLGWLKHVLLDKKFSDLFVVHITSGVRPSIWGARAYGVLVSASCRNDLLFRTTIP